MHLLGLNWQLQPADGHTFNNGIRTGLPGNDDVATMPSGGKGEVTAAACSLELPGKCSSLASWFRFFNPNLGRYAKRERKKGRGGSPFLSTPVRSCLLFLSVSSVWLRPGAGVVPAGNDMHTYAIRSTWRALELLESIPRPGQKPQHQQQLEKVLPGGGSPERREAFPWGRGSLPREEAPSGTA